MLDRVPAGGDREPSLADVEREIVEALRSGPDAAALRAEIVALLHEVGAMGELLSATFEAGSREIIARLNGGLKEFADVRVLTHDLVDDLARLQATTAALGNEMRQVKTIILMNSAEQSIPAPRQAGAADPRPGGPPRPIAACSASTSTTSRCSSAGARRPPNCSSWSPGVSPRRRW